LIKSSLLCVLSDSAVSYMMLDQPGERLCLVETVLVERPGDTLVTEVKDG
jgi:hypothetical protein